MVIHRCIRFASFQIHWLITPQKKSLAHHTAQWGQSEKINRAPGHLPSGTRESIKLNWTGAAGISDGTSIKVGGGDSPCPSLEPFKPSTQAAAQTVIPILWVTATLEDCISDIYVTIHESSKLTVMK